MGSQNSQGEENAVQWFIRKFEGENLEWPSAVAVAFSSIEGKNTKFSLAANEKLPGYYPSVPTMTVRIIKWKLSRKLFIYKRKELQTYTNLIKTGGLIFGKHPK